MDNYTIAEVAYKNGYNQAINDFVETFYEACRHYGPDDVFNKCRFLGHVDAIKNVLEK